MYLPYVCIFNVIFENVLQKHDKTNFFFSLSLSLSLSLSISLSAIHLMSRLITYGCEEMGGERQKVQGGRVSERENIGVDRAWRIENGTVHG